METEKIYVLVPVYNAEKYLERCIDSILNQTYTNWELVLVNDGSKDSSGAICDRYAAEHENITVIHQENGGVSVARNTAVEYALKYGDHKNDWISFIDSDDFVHPKYLEYLLRAAEEAGTDICCCHFARTESAAIDFADIGKPKYMLLSPETLYIQNGTTADSAWGKLYRLHLFCGIRYPEGKIFEDTYTTHKLLFRHSTVPFIETPLYYWHITPGSITQSGWSPKRINQLDALHAQSVFFREHGFMDAYQACINALFRISIRQLMYVNALSPQYDSWITEVQKRRNIAFQLFAEEFGRKEAILFWYECRIRRPLKRALQNKSVFTALKRRLKRILKRH